MTTNDYNGLSLVSTGYSFWAYRDLVGVRSYRYLPTYCHTQVSAHAIHAVLG
ncbi:MAG TPA: hypothetical protein V6D12_24525 [Candidatus Obscuribacterales bacterium]